MSDYDNRNYSTDLDTYKHAGNGILTTTISVSGSVAGSSDATFQSSSVPITDNDYGVTMYDNSRRHSGKYKILDQEGSTFIFETTFSSYVQCRITYLVTGSSIRFKLYVLNPYSSSISLQATTINLRYISYESTTN